MGNSLRDQLLKAGLVDQRRAKQAEQLKRKEHKQRQAPNAVGAEALEAARALAEKAERDRILNQKREEAAARKALAAQVRQLVQQHRLAHENGELAYHFTDGSKIKRVYVTPEIHQGLVAGTLWVVRVDGRHHVVPAETADRIRERSPGAVMPRNPDKPAEDPEDTYAAYQVPDDLMW